MVMWLISVTLETAAFATLVAAVCRIPAFSPATRHLFWTAALTTFLLPPLTNLGLRPYIYAHLPPWSDSLLATAWLLMAIMIAALNVFVVIRQRRLLRYAHAAPREIAELAGPAAGRLGVVLPDVRVIPGSTAPFLWGLGRVRLLLPQSLLQDLTPTQWRAVIAHELAHLKRRDHWTGWLQLAVACFWWWNPVFYYVRNHIAEEAELACDRWVVHLYPNDRRAYADALVEVAEFVSRRPIPVWETPETVKTAAWNRRVASLREEEDVG